jgi:hypothetical protein
MDKQWMRAPRSTAEYAAGVTKFLQFAAENAGMVNRVLCPCKTCANRFWNNRSLVSEHLVCNGFMHGYSTWALHGEAFADPDNISLPQPGAAAVDTNSDHEEHADNDEMDQMLLDGFGMYDTGSLGLDEDGEAEDEDSEADDSDFDVDEEAYKKLVEDGSKELFPGCKKISKLQFLVRLLNLKNTWKVPNTCYDEILALFKDALPEGHTLPKKFHASKRYIKDVGIGYESIDACEHDCIMFRGEYSDLQECPVCKTSRWKSVNT